MNSFVIPYLVWTHVDLINQQQPEGGEQIKVPADGGKQGSGSSAGEES